MLNKCILNFKVFEKALDEPKYSSMYAQLCLRLSEEAPNFDDPGKTGNSVSIIFIAMLIISFLMSQGFFCHVLVISCPDETPFLKRECFVLVKNNLNNIIYLVLTVCFKCNQAGLFISQASFFLTSSSKLPFPFFSSAI